jgi:Membrane bound FAD containing D-sorbitol dehydrogenase
MNHRREGNAEGAEPGAQAGKISRRAMVAGTVATTAVAAVLPLSIFDSAYAQASNPKQDMVAFLLLSEALTGVNRQTLAPEFSVNANEILNSDPGIDPINIKNTYFEWLKTHAAPSSFAKLLQFAEDNPLSPDDIIAKVNASDNDTKSLARSIVLLWYLGSWYEPGDLKANASPGTRHAVSSEVVSAKAYTQGLVWEIAGAHPMGYSNLQFGYWSRDPHDLNGPNGSPLPLFSPSKS